MLNEKNVAIQPKILVLITGCTRGLGKALYTRFIKYEVIGLNRRKYNDSDIVIDLSLRDLDAEPIIEVANAFDKVVFINNASTINPIKPINNITSADIAESILVNYINPVKLIKEVLCLEKQFVILNVTSGAAFSSNASLSLYSASKAAMHRFIDILKKENDENEKCLLIQNYDPGRMQTEMQFALLESMGTQGKYNQCKQPEIIAEDIFQVIDRAISC